MELNKIFKNKKQMVAYIICFVTIIFAFIYIGSIDFNPDIDDNIRFSIEFSSIDEDNVYVYASANDVLDVIGDDAIILFGSCSNAFTEDFASIINEVAQNSNIGESDINVSKILYYDFISDRSNNDSDYEILVNELSPYLLTDDTGDIELYAPTLMIIKDGVVIYLNEDLNFTNGNITSEEYWTVYNINEFKAELLAAFTEFIGEDN